MIYVVADIVQTRADPESGQGSPPPCLAATVCEKCLRLIFSVQHTHTRLLELDAGKQEIKTTTTIYS